MEINKNFKKDDEGFVVPVAGGSVKDARVERLDLAKIASEISGRPRSCSTSSGSRLRAASESETDSCVSMESQSAAVQESSKYRKRTRSKNNNSGSSDNEGQEKPKKLTTAKRRELRLQAEEEVISLAETVQLRANSRLSDLEGPKVDGPLVQDLQLQVADSLAIINKVACRSGNLKGTFTKALKEAAGAINAAVMILVNKSASEEVTQLREVNSRLSQELSELRKEMSSMRAELERSRAVQQPPEQKGKEDEMARSVMVQVDTLLNTRLAALEDRLLPAKPVRPPLAADRRRQAAVLRVEAERPPVTTLAAPANPGPTQKLATKKGKGKKGGQKAPPAEPRPLPPAPADTNEGWSIVVRKGKKTATVAATQKPAKKKKARSTPKQRALRPPRSAAVTLTLKPAAVTKEMTYKDVLTQVKQAIKLEDLGIEELRLRVASTGARVLELPGTNSGEKADTLAQRL